MLSRYCSNLDNIYIKTIIRILKYIKEILYYNIYYKENNNLIDYINTNFVKAINNRCLTKE